MEQKQGETQKKCKDVTAGMWQDEAKGEVAIAGREVIALREKLPGAGYWYDD